MTIHRDASIQRNEDNIIKDQLLREGQQYQEDSLEYETETLPLAILLILGTRILCSGGDL